MTLTEATALVTARRRIATLEAELAKALIVFERMDPVQVWMALPDSSIEITETVEAFTAALRDALIARAA